MLLQADAALIPLKDNSVHCCVTSPPYWGLRKYAGEQDVGEFPNLGLEPTPQEHIERMVTIFKEVKRVLRDDGVVWLNYGDSYAGSGGENTNWGLRKEGEIRKTCHSEDGTRSGLWRRNPRREKIPQGNLMLMPHRVAIALQDDGWIVRNDLIWFKRNPMPESCAGWRFERSKKRDPDWEPVRYKGKGEDPQGRTERLKMNVASARAQGIDHEVGAVGVGWEYGEDYKLRKGSWRHTRAHEYIFQLVKPRKGGMQYWCNQEAVRVRHTDKNYEITNGIFDNPRAAGGIAKGQHKTDGTSKRFMRTHRKYNPSGRNPRTVLDVPTSPYKGAHYATFPPNLIAPLIRASCPRRACPECGQGWAAVVENPRIPDKIRNRSEDTKMSFKPTQLGGGQKIQDWREQNPPQVKAYRPTCECGHDEYVPGICLDPFIGSGTTGAVARELQRRWVGLDISMEYLDMQAKIRALNLTPSNALDDLPLFNM